MNFKNDVVNVVSEALKKLGLENVEVEKLVEVPKEISHGDYSIPCFAFSRDLRRSPVEIAKELTSSIDVSGSIKEVKALGPYLNFFINNDLLAKNVLDQIDNKYGYQNLDNSTVLIESPGPNTNKPLHLGHLRNVLLGSSIYKLQKAIGKDVHIVNVVNDRGVHICKSMLAYQKFGEGKTPESECIKPDHFVGDYYVKYAEYAESNPDAEKEVQEMLIQWEQEEPTIYALWQKMNAWAFEGWAETYKKLSFEIEKDYCESDTYKGGKDIIEQGLADGIFKKDENGSTIIDLEDKGLGTKVLLRSNGTSVYITQDINMARLRNEDYSFDEMVYIVGNEQQYHFKVLFEVFKSLGWKFGDKCKHFSYGMVELPEGKMKSREGTVVDTDDVLSSMYDLSKAEVKKRFEDISDEELDKRAKIISLGAVRFFFLKHDPLKNFIFNPKESLSFEGETGPYTQYTHARICSILRRQSPGDNINYGLLDTIEDKELIQILSEFPEAVEKSAGLKPNNMCRYLLTLSQKFNSYYAKHKIIQDDKELEQARLFLISKVKTVLFTGLDLLGIVAPDKM